MRKPETVTSHDLSLLILFWWSPLVLLSVSAARVEENPRRRSTRRYCASTWYARPLFPAPEALKESAKVEVKFFSKLFPLLLIQVHTRSSRLCINNNTRFSALTGQCQAWREMRNVIENLARLILNVKKGQFINLAPLKWVMVMGERQIRS